jgi:hypothetical protein
MRRLVIGALALGACGGEAAPVALDAGAEPVDAGDADAREPAPDPSSLPCEPPAPLGELPTLTDGEAVIDLRGDDDHFRIDYNGRVGDTLLFRFALIEGEGTFANGFAAGTYPIAGDDANIEACALCSVLITHYYEPALRQYLIAQAGSVTFDRIDRTADGRLVGSASGLTLQRVIFKNDHWELQPGCTTTLEHVGFDVPLTPGPFFP